MESILNFVSACFTFLGATIGRVIAAISFGILFLFAFGFQVFRLNLWEVPSMWVGALLCWLGLWLSCVLFNTGKPAKAVALMCTVFLGFISFTRMLPDTAAGGKVVVNYQDKRNLQRAEKAVQEVPSKVRCDGGNMTSLVFFTTDGNTGERKNSFWYARSAKGNIECYDRPGFDPVFGKTLEAVDDNIVRQIALQTPPEELKPVPVPQPVLVAEAPVATVMPAATTAHTTQPESEPTPVAPVQHAPTAYVTEEGVDFMVGLTAPLDLGEHGEDYQFDGILMSDVTDANGVTLARAGTPVNMEVTSLQPDPSSDAAIVKLAVTSLTTTSGTALPTHANTNPYIKVQPARIGMKRNAIRGASVGVAVGGLLGALRDGRRGAIRAASAGALVGAGAGAALTKGQYILRPSQIRMTFEQNWKVPATLLADAR